MRRPLTSAFSIHVNLPWIDGNVNSHTHLMARGLFEQHGLAPTVVLKSEDTSGLDALVRAGSGCCLLREEVAVPSVKREA